MAQCVACLERLDAIPGHVAHSVSKSRKVNRSRTHVPRNDGRNKHLVPREGRGMEKHDVKWNARP